MAKSERGRVAATMARFYPEDMPILEQIRAHTGIRSHGEILRAALRAYARELGLAPVPAAAANPSASSEG